MQPVKLCTHVHMSGRRCKLVALTEKSYCHYHYKHYRHNNITDADYELPILEDCRSVILSMEELMRTRIKKKIDDKELISMTYAFQVASGMMNKAEAMSPDITEEVLNNRSRGRRSAGRGKEPETEEDTEAHGPSLLRMLMDEFGDLSEGNPDDPGWVRPKRTAADYKRIVGEFMRQVPASREKIFSWYPDRFWEEEEETTPPSPTDGEDGAPTTEES